MPSPDKSRTNGLWIVGVGPGRMEYMTGRAIDVISRADYVIGNDSYLEPLRPLLDGKQVIRSSMGKEVERAKKAIELAQSHKVAIVSGGDAGVYGMAGIVLEVLEHSGAEIPVEVVPGVTAANAGASLVGSPLSGDFATISLSDLLTPLEVIEKRLDAVFSVGIPVVIYNPRSHGRPDNFALAVGHARKYYPATVPVAVIKNALREGQADPVITTLGEIENVIEQIDMHTTVIIGGNESRIWRMGKNVKGIITPRGYHHKYVY
ncbi:precorrin-3B C(17)-methyltransferase [Methanoregula sp.]|uniref:precorrin-3B C(17)-methyltransferase n=1 Tax=Methanoregula sp. TaxID=2052170 RepID=UPI003568638F